MSNTDETRERIERLIAAADRVAQRPVPNPPSRSWLPLAALATAGIVAVVVIANMVSGGGDAIIVAQTTAVPTVAPGATPTSLPVVITLSPTSIAMPTTTAPVIPPSTTAPSAPSSSTTPVPSVDVVRWVTYQDGRFRLQGHVPDQGTAASLTMQFAAAAGATNVTAEYLVRAGTPLPAAEPMYAPDTFGFSPGSSSLQPAAVTFLDVVARFLLQNPAVTMDIDGHTADLGDPAAELALSQARADAVADRLVALGVARERLTSTGYGATRPVSDSPATSGRGANERIEFMLHDVSAPG